MRNNFHYGFGARLTAVILTLLMILSVSGLTLRDTGMGVDEPMIFDESYGTPVPEATEAPAAETAAPEATDAPAEDTPVPEVTEAPAEATEVPETDSGTDTNTTTSEPETTAGPQDTLAPEAEATAAPEGDMPADGPQMDEIMPIAEGNISLSIVRSGDRYILTLKNNNFTCPETDLELEFETADSG